MFELDGGAWTLLGEMPEERQGFACGFVNTTRLTKAIEPLIAGQKVSFSFWHQEGLDTFSLALSFENEA